MAFGADLCFTADVFFSFCHGISELRRSIGAKFFTVVCTWLNFTNWVQKFGGGRSPKKV